MNSVFPDKIDNLTIISCLCYTKVMNMKRQRSSTISNLLLLFTLFGCFVLNSQMVSADYYNTTAVDDVAVNVPVSCTMTGTGMNSHTATIPNGTVNSSIGETTIKAYCNDFEGFAIYAIGYTDNTNGNNVLSNSTLGSTYDIATGTATSGNNSNWAMKLSTITSPTPSFPITIESDQSGSFGSFHAVPDDYTKVAKRTSATDTGQNAEGSTLKTTYQAYISQTQLAGTYTGQVKYVLVHPNYVNQDALNDAVTVIFDGNGLTFPDGSTTNTVKYARICKPAGAGYVGSNYQEVMTSNITTGGAQHGAYADDELIMQPITITGADRLKIEVEYGITEGIIVMIQGNWDGNSEPDDYVIITEDGYDDGSKTIFIEGDTVTVFMNGGGVEPEQDYDYGMYAKIYPVYNTEQPNTAYEEFLSDDCSIAPISGEYVETTEWHDKWTATIDGDYYEFKTENQCWDDWCFEENTPKRAVYNYIISNYDLLKGSTLTIYSHNPVTFDMVYAAANKTKTNNYYAIHDLSASMCSDVSIGEITTVIDIRDNNTYSIGKLKDGNCWLRENIRLDPTNPTTAANMSASNTNATNAAISNYLNGGNPNHIDGWTDTAVGASNGSYTVPWIYHNPITNGIEFNYCAVSVGTYCYDDSYGIDRENTDIDSLYDVCPANWRLPTFPDYNGLYGIVLNDEFTIGGMGSGAAYWSSTYYNSARMLAPYVTWGDFNELQIRSYYDSSFLYRNFDYPIRCILPASN